jgi:hypothetical protein
MIKHAFIAAAALLLIGCASKNEVKITNVSGGNIYMNFRGETHVIPVSGYKTITDIPNGTYDYNTTYEIPAGYKGTVDGDAAAGTFIFEEKNTKINMIYSASANVKDATYTLHCTMSSTRNLNSTSTTGTE